MDTRNKILKAPRPEETPRTEFARPLAVVTGYFDVLRAEHARELENARARARAATLLAIVLARPGALFPQRACAEMVAALRAVDYVMLAEVGDVEELVASLQPAYLVRLEEADERRVRQLREHARSRAQG